MCVLLNGEFSSLVESFVVVDCRYPYEYEGGHIKVSLSRLGEVSWYFCSAPFLSLAARLHPQGARNLPNSDEAVEHLLQQRLRPRHPDKRLLLVFHCEFSSERAPRT